MFRPIFDHNGLCRGADIVANVLLETKHLSPENGLLLLKIIVVDGSFLHVESLCDVEVGLEVVMEF